MVDDDRILGLPDMPAETMPPELMTEEEWGDYAPEEEASLSFADNLAERMDERDLSKIAQTLIERVEWDEQSRKSWQGRERSGILMMGVSEETEGGAAFEGASKVVHPMLAEAAIQFQARAIAEVWPAAGPVNTRILGEVTQEREEQASRVKDFLNYQYTEVIPEAFDEMDRMLFRLPLSGSCFRKIYHDAERGGLQAEFVESADFVVPYTATNLGTAPRYTHIIKTTANDLRRKQVVGFYRDVVLQHPYEDSGSSDTTVKDTIDAVEGRERTPYEEDQRHTIYEAHVEYDIPGHEDPDGIALPYIIAVDRDSQKVLSIRRNWREDDPAKKKIVWFVHYKFLPGYGFYGYGFLHVIGSLSRAATGALRALLDAAAFANMQGGFRSKDCKVAHGDIAIAPGEFRETESSIEDLQRGFFKLPYDEPSRTLFMLLGTLDELGRRVAGTTDTIVGDAPTSSPVGTTVALIEQGSKVFSALHKRIHQAAGREYRLAAQVIQDTIGDDPYPYAVAGADQEISRTDFDARVDVIPVSDPSITSQTQRIAQAQACLQLAQQAPDLYDRRAAHRRMLEAMRIPDVDSLLPEQQEIPRREPIAEGAAMMTAQPVKVYPDQDHIAHLAVHDQLMRTLPPMLVDEVAPAVRAHMAEHYSMIYQQHMQETMGGQMPEGADPETENMIAKQAAHAAAYQDGAGEAEAVMAGGANDPQVSSGY